MNVAGSCDTSSSGTAADGWDAVAEEPDAMFNLPGVAASAALKARGNEEVAEGVDMECLSALFAFRLECEAARTGLELGVEIEEGFGRLPPQPLLDVPCPALAPNVIAGALIALDRPPP